VSRKRSCSIASNYDLKVGFVLCKDKEQIMPIYRAVPKSRCVPGQEIRRSQGRRLPSHVSYLADNLWEFTRPAGMPSRRHAVYASPTPELALQNAAGGLPRHEYVACVLEFHYQPSMIQLTVSDARDHPDIKRLQQVVNESLRDWSSGELDSKLALAPLFLPGVTREDLGAAMARAPLLDSVVRKAAAEVTLWTPGPDTISPDGELFFEIAEDNFYTLQPV
jgi:hypothetical protein